MTVFKNERATECLRQRIAGRQGFSVEAAFAYCDKDRDGVVSERDVRDMLSENGYFASEKETHLIMQRFDRDRDGRITKREYAEEVTPRIQSNKNNVL